MVFKKGEALGEHAEVFDTEMAGLHTVASETWDYISDTNTTPKPTNIIFYINNAAAIRMIFKGTYSKAQTHSRGFRKAVGKILENFPETKITISCCPGHSDIIGNKEADHTTKLASSQQPQYPDYKTQAYVAALHKRELLEVWRF